jgi:hypothetical protein
MDPSAPTGFPMIRRVVPFSRPSQLHTGRNLLEAAGLASREVSGSGRHRPSCSRSPHSDWGPQGTGRPWPFRERAISTRPSRLRGRDRGVQTRKVPQMDSPGLFLGDRLFPGNRRGRQRADSGRSPEFDPRPEASRAQPVRFSIRALGVLSLKKRGGCVPAEADPKKTGAAGPADGLHFYRYSHRARPRGTCPPNSSSNENFSIPASSGAPSPKRMC